MKCLPFANELGTVAEAAYGRAALKQWPVDIDAFETEPVSSRQGRQALGKAVGVHGSLNAAAAGERGNNCAAVAREGSPHDGGLWCSDAARDEQRLERGSGGGGSGSVRARTGTRTRWLRLPRQ